MGRKNVTVNFPSTVVAISILKIKTWHLMPISSTHKTANYFSNKMNQLFILFELGPVTSQTKIMDGQELLIKYYLQQSMAPKIEKKEEHVVVRSSRRLRNWEKNEVNSSGGQQQPKLIETKDLPLHPIHSKQQQIKQKNEKDSTSVIQNEEPILCSQEHTVKRFTRSSVLPCKKVFSDVQMSHDLVTPQDQPISKVLDQPTSKKVICIQSGQQLNEIVDPDINSTVKKIIPRAMDMVVSPYKQMRKSYRKVHKREIVSIPYRKCHDALEGKIVGIINKMEGNKNCGKDFQSLIERIQKISVKDMMNRFIISGLRMIYKMSRQNAVIEVLISYMQTQLVDKLDTQLIHLSAKIEEELEKIDLYEDCATSKNQDLGEKNQQYRNLFIRKIYKMLKNKFPQRSPKENREKAITDCQKVWSNEMSAVTLVKFLKHQMEISQH